MWKSSEKKKKKKIKKKKKTKKKKKNLPQPWAGGNWLQIGSFSCPELKMLMGVEGLRKAQGFTVAEIVLWLSF